MTGRIVSLSIAAALLLACGTASAQQDVYKCVDERGQTNFRNTPSANCTRIEVDPVVIPPKANPPVRQKKRSLPKEDASRSKKDDALRLRWV